MTAKLKQYKNLILVIIAAVFLIVLIAADPLGFCAKRAHERATIHNQMAVEEAEAQMQIAIIMARTEAQLERIRKGEEITESTESEINTLTEEGK